MSHLNCTGRVLLSDSNKLSYAIQDKAAGEIVGMQLNEGNDEDEREKSGVGVDEAFTFDKVWGKEATNEEVIFELNEAYIKFKIRVLSCDIKQCADKLLYINIFLNTHRFSEP